MGEKHKINGQDTLDTTAICSPHDMKCCMAGFFVFFKKCYMGNLPRDAIQRKEVRLAIKLDECCAPLGPTPRQRRGGPLWRPF